MNKQGTIIVDALVALSVTLIIALILIQICNNINLFNSKVEGDMNVIIKERDEQIRSYFN